LRLSNEGIFSCEDKVERTDQVDASCEAVPVNDTDRDLTNAPKAQPALARQVEVPPQPARGPLLPSVHLPQWPRLDAGLVHREDEVGDALVLGASQVVRATSMPRSAWWALVFQSFCPFTAHSSPSGRR
jgi:hypothetical protein